MRKNKIKSGYKIIGIIFVFCFLFVSNTANADNGWIYWVNSPSEEIGSNLANSVGFTTKPICEGSTNWGGVHSSRTKSPGCYLAEDVTISNFAPTSGKFNDIITITGTNFTGVNNVLIGGVPATNLGGGTSTTTMRVQISAATKTGPIIVKTNLHKEATSKTDFTISSTPDDMRWWYKNMASNNIRGPFTSPELCNQDRDTTRAASISITLGECYQDTITNVEKDKKDSAVGVDPKKDTTLKSDVYTFLAPLTSEKTAPTNIGDYFNWIFTLAIGLCGALAVIMIVIGGVQYMGEESIFGKTKAREQITNAILGLLIALGAFALLNTINPDLLNTGINIKSVSATIDDTPILVESSPSPTGVAVGTKGLCPGGLGNVTAGGVILMHTCVSISTQVTNMIALALSQGINLSGSSYRSNADQMALRVKNCANALTTPSSQCKPPTAIAGNSKHESGLAIDFKCNGTIIQTTDNACFLWLQTNAKNYGLTNYQPEPWHWST